MDLFRHCRRHMHCFKVKLFFFFPIINCSSLPASQLHPFSHIFFNIKTAFSFQTSLLWYFTQTNSMKLNANLELFSKNGPSSTWVLFWCELLIRHTRHISHILHTKPPFGISAVRLWGRSVTRNGSISVHITEHIPYKAAASVYSLPPVRCWHPVAALYLRQCGGCVVFVPCEPCYVRWLEHLCQWLRGQMEQQRTFWRSYGN